MMQVATHLDAEVVALATDDRTSGPWLTFWSTRTYSSITSAVPSRSRWAVTGCTIRSSRAELVAGTSASDLINQLLDPFRELVVDRAVAERAGRIRRESGVRLPDALIAATAVEHGMSLATRNRRDFEGVRGRRLRSVG